MQNIIVGRYSSTSMNGVPGIGIEWQGWIEPEDKSWIAFIAKDGKPVFYLYRDPETGAILDDMPSEQESTI